MGKEHCYKIDKNVKTHKQQQGLHLLAKNVIKIVKRFINLILIKESLTFFVW